jgi:hypothetical protein
MKSRLSSTIWTLVLFNGLAYLAVLWLAFGAGKKAGDAGFDISSPGVIGGLLVARAPKSMPRTNWATSPTT